MSQNYEFPVYIVGQLFDAHVRRWDEGAMYLYHMDIHQVLIFLSKIRPYEQQAFVRGVAHFGLYVDGDVITLLFKMDGPDGRGIDWHEAPYSWHLVPREARTLPPSPEAISEGAGVPVFIFLIDASTGILQALRTVSLSNEFARKLCEAIRQQTSRPFNQQKYMRQVMSLRQRFPSPLDLANKAQVVCQIGHDGVSASEERSG